MEWGAVVAIAASSALIACLAIWGGSYDAVSLYRRAVQKGEKPSREEASIAFSLGAGYVLFMTGIFLPLGYVVENWLGIPLSNWDLPQLLSFWALFLGMLLGIFATAAACELLLRKLTWYREPGVHFEPFMGLPQKLKSRKS